MTPISRLLAVVTKALAFLVKDLREEASYKFNFIFTFWGVIFSVLVFYFLSKVIPDQSAQALSRYGGSYFSFSLLGIAFANYLDLAMHGMGRKIREAQMLGTFEALLLTGTPPAQILTFSVLYQFLFTSLVVAMYLLFGAVFFDLDLSRAAWGSAVLTFLLTGAALAPLGILSAAVILILKRGEPVSHLVSGLSFLLSGVFYPVAVLPEWLQTAALFFPLTHGLEGMRRSLLMGVPIWQEPMSFAVLGLFAVLLLPVSLFVFSRTLRHARKSGGLNQY